MFPGRYLPAVLLLAIATPGAAEPLSLEAALREAERQSPDLAARALSIDEARSSAIPAAALPDPKLFVGVDNFPVSGPPAFNPAREDMAMATVGVMQEVPNRAKRRSRAAVAQADVEVARAELAAQRRTVLAAVAEAWADLYFHHRRLAALDVLERENRLLGAVTPDRIASGAALPAQTVDPGLETAALANRRTELTREAAAARAELVRWIGARGDEPLAPTAPDLTIDPIHLRAALDDHPSLLAFGPRLERAHAEVRGLQATRRPDYSVQGAFSVRHPDFGNMVSAQVTVDLPVFASRRQGPLIEAGRLRANRLELERQAARRELQADLEKGLAEHDALTERAARLRRDTLPLAKRKVELLMASFEAGAISFDEVLEARRQRVEAEISAVDLEAQAGTLAARLVTYFGRQDT